MMKKLFMVAAAILFLADGFATGFELKGNVLCGGSPVQEDYDSKTDEMIKKYGKSYFLGDLILSNERITVGTKIYYRIPAAEKAEDFSQRMELKRAFLRVRPFANDIFEISGGKLYSYYLPGNFFNIAEIYTGASRWGKSGVGIKSEFNGFTLGLAIPVGESVSKLETATKFDDFFALNGALGFDFATLNDSLPLKLNFDAGFRRTKKYKAPYYKEIYAASVNYAPKFDGFISKMNLTLTYSWNAEPLVANTGFTAVINYNDPDLAWCHFASVNYRSNFGPVHFTLEGEAGHSVEGHKIPVYLGTQLLIPFTDIIAIKPRFMYYAALDDEKHMNDRSSFEIYPRLWITFNQWTFSLGMDFVNKEVAHDTWKWEWSVPFYVEYKIK